MEGTEKSHRKFSQKIEVTPNEITITPLDEQFIEIAIKIVEELSLIHIFIDANILFDEASGKTYLYYSRCCYKHAVESEVSAWAKTKGWFEDVYKRQGYSRIGRTSSHKADYHTTHPNKTSQHTNQMCTCLLYTSHLKRAANPFITGAVKSGKG